MVCSNAVKLTAEILHKQAYIVSERTDRMKMSEMTKTEQEDETTKDDRRAGNPDHEPKKAKVAPTRLLAKQKRRIQTRSVQREAQQQRKRR